MFKKRLLSFIKYSDSSQHLDGCRTATLLAILIWLRIIL